LVERATALAAEVQRLEEAGAELEARAVALAVERDDTLRRIEDLHTAVIEGQAKFDADVRALDDLRRDVVNADDTVAALRAASESQEAAIREARGSLD